MADVKQERRDPKFKPPSDPDAVGKATDRERSETPQPPSKTRAVNDLRFALRIVKRLGRVYANADENLYLPKSSSSLEARVKASGSDTTYSSALADERTVKAREALWDAWKLIDDGIGKLREAERRIISIDGGKVRRNRDGTPVRGPGMKQDDPPTMVSKDDLRGAREAQDRREARGDVA